jgi:hypothetical protein
MSVVSLIKSIAIAVIQLLPNQFYPPTLTSSLNHFACFLPTNHSPPFIDSPTFIFISAIISYQHQFNFNILHRSESERHTHTFRKLLLLLSKYLFDLHNAISLYHHTPDTCLINSKWSSNAIRYSPPVF